MRTHTPWERATYCRNQAVMWHHNGRRDLSRNWIIQMDRWLEVAADALADEISVHLNTR